jgi:hypothetical protein
MKLLRILFAGLLILTGTIFSVPPANAGQLTAVGVTISWEDELLYQPSSGNCSTYIFTFTDTRNVLLAYIKIKNKFGEEIGRTPIHDSSGKASVQVCSSADLSGSRVFLEITGGSKSPSDIVSAPITFLSRTSTASAKPTPTPTRTVTATPSPTPTVYVTNPADANLRGEILLLKAEIIALNLKLKKICSAKPKPKGC